MMNREEEAEQRARLFAAEIGDVPEIDVHGFGCVTATQEIEFFIDKQFMAGEDAVRIVHGRGTGALRSTTHDLLSEHKLVETFADSMKPEELLGVTYALLVRRT